jgi:ATP-dependent DNA helicase RecQ
MRNAHVIVRGFDRPNIRLGVVNGFQDESAKQRALLDQVAEAEKPGIIYTATRRRAEELAMALVEREISAEAYHAGMKASERERVQQAFMGDQIDVIVATTAFGMGIDKPNVRFVFHHDISESVDAYYQEIGRAGRDGAFAQAILFYRYEDLGLRRYFNGSGQIDVDTVEQVAQVVQAQDEPINLRDLRDETELSQSKLTVALSRLEEVGAVELLPTGEVRATERKAALSEAAEQAADAQERYQQFERSRIAMIQGYAEVRDCRRGYLLNYFGEDFAGPCGNCDTCEAGITVERDANTEPFPLNSRVRHRDWGEGLVMRYEGEKIVVLFDSVGYKTLALDLVVENNLLEGAG